MIFFIKEKILKALKKLLNNDIKIIFDVGGHNGESILLFNKNFNFLKFILLNLLKNNFLKLKINTKKIAKKLFTLIVH